MTTLPRVSCIMPTRNRRAFIRRALQCFRGQDYESMELVILDDGTDAVGDLIPSDSRVRYLRCDPGRTVGAKRNALCREARGEIIVHWDDDDWYPSWRVRCQVEALTVSDAIISGSSTHYFHEPSSGRAWRYRYIGGGFVTGATFAYRKTHWEQRPFADVQVGEDTGFVQAVPRGRMVDLALPSLCVSTIHPGNVSPKMPFGTCWVPVDPGIVKALLEEPTPTDFPEDVPIVSCMMPTANRRAFVEIALELFAAQDYARAELIVVDSGGDEVQDLCGRVPRVRYVRTRPGATIGAQRNLACDQARGEIMLHWDDDDWYRPDRLSRQIEPILAGRADVTGLQNQYTLNVPDGSFWTMNDRLHQRMFAGNVHGGTLAYRRSLLANGARYLEVNLAEDAALLKSFLQRGARLERVANDGVFVYNRHGRNAWRFQTGTFLDPTGWSKVTGPTSMPAAMVERYRAIGDASRATVVPGQRPIERLDCLGNTEIPTQREPPELERCIAIAATESYAGLLDDALTSLARFGELPDVPRIILVSGHAPRCLAVAARHGALVMTCRLLRGHAPSLKGALYSIGRYIKAGQYLCLDADVLVVGSLAPLFEKHAALPKGQVLVASEATRAPTGTLAQALQSVYLATPGEVERLLDPYASAVANARVINDGVFVADQEGLAKVDDFLRSSAVIRDWIGARRDVWWRQKAALNIALASADALANLDGGYNVQLHVDRVERHTEVGAVGARWSGRPAKILHFNGTGRRMHADWRNVLLNNVA